MRNLNSHNIKPVGGELWSPPGLQVFVHVLGSTATVAHSQNDGGSTTHDVASGKYLCPCRLHALVDDYGVLASQFQSLYALGYEGVGTDTDGHDDLVNVECDGLALYGYW